MKIDAHHHLWDLKKVNYPWLMAKGEKRFFGDPSKIQRNYLWEEFSKDALDFEFQGSVHIQVGAKDPLEEAKWVDSINNQNRYWPLAQVAFADLTDEKLDQYLDKLCKLDTVKGVRQIVGRAPEEDSFSKVNQLLDNPRFLRGLNIIADRKLTFDLQLIPNIMIIVLISGLITAAVGILFGLPSLRIKGFYLAVATLASQFFLVWLFNKVPWFYNYSDTGQITVSERVMFGVPVTGATYFKL